MNEKPEEKSSGFFDALPEIRKNPEEALLIPGVITCIERVIK